MDEHRQGVATNGARAESRSEQGWGKDRIGVDCWELDWQQRLGALGFGRQANEQDRQQWQVWVGISMDRIGSWGMAGQGSSSSVKDRLGADRQQRID